MIDITKLTPAPWELTDEGWCVDADMHEHQEFIAIARNAFDVMMRQGWGVVLVKIDNQNYWCVPQLTPGICMPIHRWPDPFTALIEADKWYKENVEKSA